MQTTQDRTKEETEMFFLGMIGPQIYQMTLVLLDRGHHMEEMVK